jgi:hypothetical protein
VLLVTINRKFWKNSQISNLIKIPSVGAEIFDADEETDLNDPIITFRKFAKTPDIVHFLYNKYLQNARTYVYLTRRNSD